MMEGVFNVWSRPIVTRSLIHFHSIALFRRPLLPHSRLGPYSITLHLLLLPMNFLDTWITMRLNTQSSLIPSVTSPLCRTRPKNLCLSQDGARRWPLRRWIISLLTTALLGRPPSRMKVMRWLGMRVTYLLTYLGMTHGVIKQRLWQRQRSEVGCLTFHESVLGWQ